MKTSSANHCGAFGCFAIHKVFLEKIIIRSNDFPAFQATLLQATEAFRLVPAIQVEFNHRPLSTFKQRLVTFNQPGFAAFDVALEQMNCWCTCERFSRSMN